MESIEQPDAVRRCRWRGRAGVVDHIKHRNYGRSLFEFHGGMRAADSNAYYNKHAECWMVMRDWLKAGAEIPDDPELAIDLSGPEYGFSNRNQIQLEKKQSMKDRGLASPDLGDALGMTFAVEVAARPKREPSLSTTFLSQRMDGISS